MTIAKDAQDPSMDEILSSIRQLIATESKRKAPASPPQKMSEEVLDLTNLLPDEACSAARIKEQKAEEPPASKKGMRLPAWAENIKMPFPTESQKGEHSRKEDLFLSRAAAEETAQAIHSLTQAVQQDTSLGAHYPLKEVDNQALERQVRELLKPLLKEWLDTNLPVLVKWIVNEQIEKLMHQYGLFSASKK